MNKTTKRKRYPIGKLQRRNKMRIGQKKRRLWEKSDYYKAEGKHYDSGLEGTNHERAVERAKIRKELRTNGQITEA